MNARLFFKGRLAGQYGRRSAGGPTRFGMVLAAVALLVVDAARSADLNAPSSAAYVTDMRQVQQALDGGNRSSALELLGKYSSQSGAADPRGFEWRYFSRLARGESNSTNSPERDTTSGLVPRNPDSALVFLGDNRTLLAACTNNTLKLFDVVTLEAADEIAGAYHPMALSTDGKTVIVIGYSGLQLWDARVRTLAPMWLFPQAGDWSLAAFSPDVSVAAIRAGGVRIELLDVARRAGITMLPGHTGGIRALTFSPDGRTFASAGMDRLVKYWSLEQRRLIATLTNHTAAATCVAFSPDSKLLASGSADQAAILWDVAGNSAPRRLEGHRQAVQAVAFSTDGKTLASGSADNTVKLWNVASGQEVATLASAGAGGTNPGKAVVRLGFSPDGTLLAARLSDGTLRVWRAAPLNESIPAGSTQPKSQ